MAPKSQKRGTDRGLILFLLLLLIAEASWLIWDFQPRGSDRMGERAGYVISKANSFLKRSSQSLAWNPAQKDDELYYYDLVMTLSKSQAKIHLNEKTEVTLSENTLILIEPPQNDKDNQIRLKLSRGDLRARNPFVKTEIQNPNWNLTLEKGSEVEITQTDTEQFQIQVKDGEAVLNSGQVIGKDQMVEIEKSEIQAIQALAKKFTWLNQLPRRIYSQDDKVSVQLQWEGEAKVLRWQNERIAVDGARSYELALPAGHHRIQAETSEGLSPWIEFEIWKAPILHLLNPLPRSRLKTDRPQVFSWEGNSNFPRYKIEFKDHVGTIVKSQELSTTFDSIEIEQEADWEWQVKAFDQEGFEVPLPDQYPIYFRHEPFEAPRVKKLELRKPARDSSKLELFFLLFNSQAWARPASEDLWEARFSWEEIAGADQYVIEISETPDFRNPLVNQTIKKAEFTWTSVRDRKYYWRVAAGSSRGRMGVFTEPLLVEFTKPAESTTVKKTVKPKPSPAPVVEAAPPSEPSKESEHWQWMWQPAYVSSSLKSKEGFDVNLQGGSFLSFAVEDEDLWSWRLDYTQTKYKPDPADRYPDQTDLTLRDGSFELRKLQDESGFSWGGKLKSASWFEKNSAATIQNKSDFRAGAVFPKGLFRHRTHLEILMGSQAHELGLGYQYRRPSGSWIWGVGVDGSFLLQDSKSSQILKAYLILGFGAKPEPSSEGKP